MVFQQLYFFVAVAEYGSINRAADHLFISQQALRASINSLERKLGFRLFERSARGMVLTDAGQAVYADVKQILQMETRWQRYVDPETPLSGTVRIIASTIVCGSVLTNVVLKCRALYPELNITLFEAREDELLNAMSRHMIGILGSAPVQVVKNKIQPYAKEKHLSLETYATDEFYVFLNSRHALATRDSLSCDNLEQLVLAIYPHEEKKFYYGEIYSKFNPATPYYMQRQENIFQLIAENINVASVFPHIGVINNHYVEQGMIRALPVADFPMPGISCMLFPSNTNMTLAEKVVSEMIRTRMNEISRQFQLEAAKLD